ncbi:MAG: hypothetical protein GQ561_07435 [Calditrichae bacterium]|nr:hypothetical protein [Calditrichia bacterium]
MKTSILLIMLTTVLMGNAQKNNAKITIHSIPDQVQIRVNSVIVGITPIIDYEVESGYISIEAISNETGIWNNHNIVQEIFVTPGQDTTIQIKFPKMVKINSIPFHAKLMVNDQFMGLTPISIEFDRYRGKEFLIEKTNYNSFRFFLENPNSQLYTLEPLDISALEAENISFTYGLFHSNMKSKFLFLSGTVVTHWLAFYFKNLADSNFDKYTNTANPALMQKYWNNTQKYDRWSDITLGVSYAFLGGLIYTVLWR